MLRVHRDIARDAARIAAAPLAQVIVVRGGSRGEATTAAVDGTALVTDGVRGAVAALLAAEPGHGPAAALLGGPGRERVRATAACEPRLVAALWPYQAGARDVRSAFYRLSGAGDDDAVLLRFVLAGKLRSASLRALDAVARFASARLEAERLRRSAAGRDAAYRAFQQSAGEAIFVVDPRSGRVLEGNEKLSELTGRTPRELRRLPVSQVLEHPLEDGRALLARLAKERVAREDEARLLRRRGEPIPVSLTTARIELPEGAVLHVIARDVARERRALSELRQARDTLAALHVAGAHLMVETDEEAIYAVIARELLRLGVHCGVLAPAAPESTELAWRFTSFPAPLQRAMERVLGRPLRDLRIDPAAAPLVRRCLEEARTVHTDRGRTAVQDLLGGASRPQLRALGRLVGLRRVILAPLRRDGRPWGVLAVAAPRLRRSDPDAIDAFALQASIALEKARLFSALRDQRARLETAVDQRTEELQLAVRALEEAHRRKDNFLANVSHELRTPLVTVLGYSDLLLAEKLGPLLPRQRSALGVVQTSGRRLKRFIEELLEFERHELTKDRLAFAPFDIGEALTQVALSLAPRFAERGVRLKVRIARGTPRVWGDRERVAQVLVNLITNAERYSPERGAVRVAAARVRPGRVEVAVSDRGPGIAEEHVARIFDRFYQVRDDRAARHKGGALGLGLAIVKSIVEAHGGAVSVRSRVGRGTTFRFSLPTAEVLEGGAAAPDPAPTPEPALADAEVTTPPLSTASR